MIDSCVCLRGGESGGVDEGDELGKREWGDHEDKLKCLPDQQ